MTIDTAGLSYNGFRSPDAISSHAVWLSVRWNRSDRAGADVLADCGVAVTDATVRQWCRCDGEETSAGHATQPQRSARRIGEPRMLTPEQIREHRRY